MLTAHPPFVQTEKRHEQGGMQHGCHRDGGSAHEVKDAEQNGRTWKVIFITITLVKQKRNKEIFEVVIDSAPTPTLTT